MSASERTTIEADIIESNDKKNTIKAKGNVVITKDDYNITTENIVYDKNNKLILLNNKAKVVSADKKTIFAENGLLTDDIKEGEFNKAGIIFDNGMSVMSNKIIKKDANTYVAKDTNYFLCPNKNITDDLSYDEIMAELKKEKKDIVSFYSKESIILMDKKKIYLKHNQIKLFNIPIFYWPTISTSRPFIDKVSGFGFPNFEKLSQYGAGIYFPYNWYVNENLKLKFTTGIYQYGSLVFKIKSLYENDYTRTFIDYSFIFDNYVSKSITNKYEISEENENEYRNYRNILKLNSDSQLTDNLFLNLNLNLAGDKYIIRDFLSEYDDFLQSDLNLSYINFDTFNYYNFNIVSFREIMEDADIRQKSTPLLLPSFNMKYSQKILEQYIKNLYLTTKLNVITTDISDINDMQYNKINLSFNVNKNILFHTFNINFFANLYNDFYFKGSIFDNIQYIGTKTKSSNYRIIPEIGINIKNTYKLKQNANITFEPIIQYFVSPNLNKYNNSFINEDSLDSEINILNLFNSSRYNGTDRREYGSRLNYGFINNYILDEYNTISFRLGQAYKDSLDQNAIIKGFEYNFSDILTGISFVNSKFDVHFLLNIDNTKYNINSNEILYNIYLEKLKFFGSYTYFNKQISVDKPLHELSFGFNYNFIGKLNLTFETKRDLIKNRTIENQAKFFYENDCIITGVKIKQDSYINSLKSVNINFYFNIKNSMF